MLVKDVTSTDNMPINLGIDISKLFKVHGTRFTQTLKMLICITWMTCYGVGAFPQNSSKVTIVSFVMCILSIVLINKLHLPKPSLARKPTVITTLVFMSLPMIFSNHGNDYVYVVWYFILVLLILTTSNAITVPYSSSFFDITTSSSFVDLMVLIIIICSFINSVIMLKYNSVVSINANAYTAICGFILITYTTQNLIFQESSIKYKLYFSKFIILCSALAAVCTFSRAVIFWLIAAHYLSKSKKNAALKSSKVIVVVYFIVVFSSISPVFLLGSSDLSDFSNFFLSLPKIIRVKEGGLESDLSRIMYYPVILSNHLKTQSDIVFGLGVRQRPYKDDLKEGEDLHNAYLSVVSDLGLFGLFVICGLIFFVHQNNILLHCAVVSIFVSGVAYSGIFFGVVPLTVGVCFLFSGFNRYLSLTVSQKRRNRCWQVMQPIDVPLVDGQIRDIL